MIVKINEQNHAIYDAFFDKISKAFAADVAASNPVVNKNIVINNINEYYAHITDIAKLDGRFLRLPLWDPENEIGEEFFTINADTRKVTIPNHFKVNGIAVQEDNLAEIVYFTIDRYFDRTDLSTKDIEIRWALTSKGGKAPIAADSVAAVFIDDEALAMEGKLVFGWPITREMAQESGSLSFSVSFYSKLSGTERLYSLNTIPASVTVNSGLTLINPSCTDYSEDIMKCLVASEYTADSMAPLTKPVWTYLTWQSNNKPTYGYAYYNDIPYELVNLGPDGTADLEAMAYTAGNEIDMVYSWDGNSIFKNDGSEELEALNASFENLQSTLKVKEVNYADGIKEKVNYFDLVNSGDGVESYKVLHLAEVEKAFADYDAAADAEKESVHKIYEGYNCLKVSEPGIYAVHAQAKSETVNSDGQVLISTSKQITSTSCIVPEALPMIVEDIKLFTDEIADVALLDKSIKDNYQYVADDLEEVQVYIDVPSLPIDEAENDKMHRGEFALVLSDDDKYNEIIESFEGVNGAMYKNEVAQNLDYKSFYDEETGELANIGTTVSLNNGSIKLFGVVVHKLNKTYALSNVFESKIISTEASDFDFDTKENLVIKAVDNAENVFDFKYNELGNLYTTDTFGDETPITLTVEYAGELKKSAEVTYKWFKKVGNDFIELVSDENVIVNGNSISFIGPDYEMTGIYQVELTNIFNNTFKTKRLPHAIQVIEF